MRLLNKTSLEKNKIFVRIQQSVSLCYRNSGGSGGEDDQLSRSASDSSVSANHKQSAPGTPLPAHGSVILT